MRAVQFSSYGGGVAGLQHVEIPVPIPKADEVLLKVEAAGINPADLKIQSGWARPFLPLKFPFIPGTDVAGEVVQVGSSVNKFKVGDKVVAILGMLQGGALAEYAVAKESLTAARPPEVPAAEAAALPVAALSAYQILQGTAKLDLDGTKKGEGERKNVLITAASGGVGHYAVQLAKLGNAHVTATCGARNLGLVSSLGADEVLDYRTPEGAALASPSGKKYDLVVHCAHGIPWSTFEPSLSERGRVIDLTPTKAAMLRWLTQRLTLARKRLEPYILTPKAEDIERLVGLARDGKLRTVLDSRFGLSEAEDAWGKLMEGHATGKVIVEP